MAKPHKGSVHVTARTPPAAPSTVPTPDAPPSETPAVELPRRDQRFFYGAIVFWVAGFMALVLLLMLESIPLLWDLIRFKL
jgi:hypothetical protein